MYFWQNFSKFKQNIALVEAEQQLSYEEFNEQILNFSQQLNKTPDNNKYVNGKKILLLGIDNSIDSIVAFYAALAGDHVVLVCDNNNTSLRENLKLNFRPHFEYFDDGGVRDLVALDNPVNSSDIHPDLALLISTSGSTGSSKCVRISKENLAANTQSICQYLDINDADNAALILPIHYCYGLSVLNTHLASGATVHVGDLSVASSDFIDYLAINNISSVAGVPYTFEILERANFRDKQLPSLRYMTQAGGRLAPELVAKYAKWALASDKAFFVMYGQTEATARMAYLPLDKIEKFPGSIGLPIPGGAFFIKSEDGSLSTESNIEGELVYKGANVMMGYALNAEELSKASEHEYLSTGDVAYKDDNDLFFIVGRLKRFTKIYGKRFNLDEIERSISSLGVTSTCVSDDKNLYISIEGKSDIDIINHVETTFGIASQNIDLYSYDRIPLMASGKVDYRTILSSAVKRREDQDAKNTNTAGNELTDKEVKQLVINAFKKHLKSNNIKPDDTFTALGGDSMSYVGMSIELENILGQLPENWQNIKIKDISHIPVVKKKHGYIQVDILLRVFAVLAVVVFHSGVDWVRGGAALLLLLAGYNYSRFQFSQQLKNNPLKIFKDFTINVLVPYWSILIGYTYLKYGQIDWEDVFLFSNNLAVDTAHEPFGIWFIQALVQSILILTIPLLFTQLRKLISQNINTYFALALAVACFAHALDAVNGWYRVANGMEITWCFWLFALGALIQTHANKGQLRTQLLLMFLAISLSFGFYYNDISRAVMLTLGSLAIINISNVPLPRALIPAINIVASSSLFIYMLHPRAPVDSITADFEFDIIRVVSGIALGIIGHYIYGYIKGLFLSNNAS